MVIMAFENLQSDRGCQLHIPPIVNNPVLGQVCLNKVKAKHECKITLSRGVGVTYRFPRITDNCSRWSSSSNWFKVSFINATFFTFLFPQSTEIHSRKNIGTHDLACLPTYYHAYMYMHVLTTIAGPNYRAKGNQHFRKASWTVIVMMSSWSDICNV